MADGGPKRSQPDDVENAPATRARPLRSRTRPGVERRRRIQRFPDGIGHDVDRDHFVRTLPPPPMAHGAVPETSALTRASIAAVVCGPPGPV